MDYMVSYERPPSYVIKEEVSNLPLDTCFRILVETEDRVYSGRSPRRDWCLDTRGPPSIVWRLTSSDLRRGVADRLIREATVLNATTKVELLLSILQRIDTDPLNALMEALAYEQSILRNT